METKTITLVLTPAEVALLDDVSWHQDRGATGEGWQSDAMESLGRKIRAAIEATKEKGDA